MMKSENQSERVNRDNGIDLLRIIAAFLVVTGHVMTTSFSQYYEKLGAGGSFTPDITSWILSFFRCGHWAVVAFFMVSGAFVLSSSKTGDFSSFYSKTWKKLGIPTLVFSIIYIIAVPLNNVITGQADAATAIFYELFLTLQGMPARHMWYMFVLIGMYLFAPFLVLGREKMGNRAFARFAIAAYIIGCLGCYVQRPAYYWSISTIANELGIFMMGFVIHDRIGSKKNNKLAACFIALGFALQVLLTVLYVHSKLIGDISGIGAVFAELEPFNPLVNISGGLFFAGIRLLDIKGSFFGFAELSYYIYLVHPLVIMPLLLVTGIWGLPAAVLGRPVSLAVALVLTLVTFILSWLVSQLIVTVKGRKKS